MEYELIHINLALAKYPLKSGATPQAFDFKKRFGLE